MKTEDKNSISPLAKKLQIKAGKRWLLYNAPVNYNTLIEPLPGGFETTFNAEDNVDGIQLFVKDSVALRESLKVIGPLLKPDTMFWITYPKKSSGIKSDLEMMGNWDALTEMGLRIVTSAAIDATWTALRFKPAEQVKESDSRNANILNNDYSKYIDVATKQVKLPDEMQEILTHNSAAMAFYQSLSYSNKKEYVVWVLSAKQEATKADRLKKVIEKLAAGKKNPSEK